MAAKGMHVPCSFPKCIAPNNAGIKRYHFPVLFRISSFLFTQLYQPSDTWFHYFHEGTMLFKSTIFVAIATASLAAAQQLSMNDTITGITGLTTATSIANTITSVEVYLKNPPYHRRDVICGLNSIATQANLANDAMIGQPSCLATSRKTKRSSGSIVRRDSAYTPKKQAAVCDAFTTVSIYCRLLPDAHSSSSST